RHALAAEVAIVAGEAVAGLEVEAPVVEAAGEDAVGDLAEPGEVGLAVRAPAFDAPAVALEELVGAAPRRAVTPLDVGDPFRRERLEEGHDELVEWSVAVCGEPAREEQRVDPVLDVLVDERLDQRAVDVDLVDVGLAAPDAHLRVDE